MKRTEDMCFKDVKLSVTKHRDRAGCDICKKDTATECFIGWCGNVLWVCSKCFKKLIHVQLTKRGKE